MGFLRKGLKFVKKQIKKVGKVVKKVFKKIKKSKILKAIALVGAAIVTGGAFVGAYGGTLASSTVGSWLASTSAKILATPVVGTLATPFKWLGAAAGTGAGKVTDFLGFTSEAGRLGVDTSVGFDLGSTSYDPISGELVGPQSGQINMDAMNFGGGSGTTYNPLTGQVETSSGVGLGAGTAPVSYGVNVQGITTEAQRHTLQGSVKVAQSNNLLGKIGQGLQYAQDVAGVYQSFQDSEQSGVVPPASYGGNEQNMLAALQVAYAQPVVNIGDAYSNLSYGTGDIGYLASDLYRQQTIGAAV